MAELTAVVREDDDAGRTAQPVAGPTVMVVGSGWRFTSGISYYTCRLSNELARTSPTSALLMRGLVPRKLYPGRERVGVRVNDLDYAPEVPVFDGVDWYWGPTMRRALDFLRQQRPDVVVLQWWTGAVLHSYLRLAREAVRLGARVIVEFHEVQDTGEARLPLASRYVGGLMPRLLAMADGCLVHSEYDLAALTTAFGTDLARRVEVVPHGPYDFAVNRSRAEAAPRRDGDVVRLLHFGTIRPYKGLEDLVDAFDGLTDDQAARYELHIVGETWEGWDLPLLKVAASRHRGRIHVVNRYVSDSEVSEAFAAADLVVLPYRRSSSSGPLHIAMSAGMPVVVSAVGGLVEASEGYEGVRRVPPGDPAALRQGILDATALVGRTYADPRSWAETCGAIHRLAGVGR